MILYYFDCKYFNVFALNPIFGFGIPFLTRVNVTRENAVCVVFKTYYKKMSNLISFIFMNDVPLGGD